MNIEELMWKDWKIVQTLGKGSYGTVYKVCKSGFGNEIYSAVKHMSIPSDESEAESLKADGMSSADIDLYYQEAVDNISKEIMLMETLKGTTNIVNIEDFKIEKKKSVGWDILIRMELLDDLNSYFTNKSGYITDIVSLGIDMCTALEVCFREGIIHRDIKPENIFVNQHGNFKLGDFGIARQYQTNLNMSMRGTPFYAAPEMFEGGRYDHTVDIYSLGLVLYRLLNCNKLPFFPIAGTVTFQQRNEAVRRRLAGEQLPNPINSTVKLNKVISKACSKNPRQRYQTPGEFKNALINVLNDLNRSKAIPRYNFSSQAEGPTPTPVTGNLSKSISVSPPQKNENSKKVIIIAVAVVAIIAMLVGIISFALLGNGSNAPTEQDTQQQTYIANPENDVSAQDFEQYSTTEGTTAEKKKTTTTKKETTKASTTKKSSAKTTTKKTTTAAPKKTTKKSQAKTTTKKTTKKNTTTKKSTTKPKAKPKQTQTQTQTQASTAAPVGSVSGVYASKSGKNVRVTWNSASNASSYSVSVTSSNGFSTSTTTGSTRIQIPVSGEGTYYVTVTPYSNDGRAGGSGSSSCTF